MPQDVYAAMKELEFEFMLPRLEAEVTKFTSIQADKRNTYRKKIRDEKKAAKDPTAPNGSGAATTEDSPPTKRARRLSADNGEHHSGSDEDVEGDETVDVEDEEVEDDEVEEEVVEEGLTEDLLEERVDREEDDEMADGDESD
jgi:hypothetical protein